MFLQFKMNLYRSITTQRSKGKNKIILLFLILFMFGLIDGANIFDKVVLRNPDALCLDGSPGVYHVRKGAFANKWIVGFEGGGWCGSSIGIAQTIEDCYKRTLSTTFPRGSSIGLPEIQIIEDGLYSDIDQNHYRDWSMAYLRYCTFSEHQGYKKDPIKYKGSNLYFRAHNVSVAYFDSLNALFGIFTSATTEIIVYGGSIGGLGALTWTNYIKDRADSTTKVISLIDGGIFFDIKNYRTGEYSLRKLFQNFMTISNAQVDPPTTECNAAHKEQLWKCMFSQNLIPHIKVPLFVVQSRYDAHNVRHVMQIICQIAYSYAQCNKDEMDYIEQFSKLAQTFIKKIPTYNPKNGYWSVSCANHVFTTTYTLYSSRFRIPSGSDNSLIKAIVEWQEEQPVSYEHMDNVSWPNNQGCAQPLKQSQQMLSIVSVKRIISWLIVLSILVCLCKRIKSWEIRQENELSSTSTLAAQKRQLSSFKNQQIEEKQNMRRLNI